MSQLRQNIKGRVRSAFFFFTSLQWSRDSQSHWSLLLSHPSAAAKKTNIRLKIQQIISLPISQRGTKGCNQHQTINIESKKKSFQFSWIQTS